MLFEYFGNILCSVIHLNFMIHFQLIFNPQEKLNKSLSLGKARTTRLTFIIDKN